MRSAEVLVGKQIADYDEGPAARANPTLGRGHRVKLAAAAEGTARWQRDKAGGTKAMEFIMGSRNDWKAIDDEEDLTAFKTKRRRQFLQGLGAGFAGIVTGTTTVPARAQPQFLPLKVIDFHNHFVGSAFTPIVGTGTPPARRAYFDAVNRNLADAQALLGSIEAAGIAARVVNTPLEFIQDPEGPIAPDTVTRINDQLAELVSRNPGRL